MDSNEIRVGKISSVDYTSGTVRVVTRIKTTQLHAPSRCSLLSIDAGS